MAEVLSQEEIDALLSALSSGDVEPETIDSVEEDIHKVKQYDFKTPQKLYCFTLCMSSSTESIVSGRRHT